MPHQPNDFRYGRIIGCYLPGRNGKRALHPAVIVSPGNEIIQPAKFDPRRGGDNLLALLGISTQYKKFSDPCIPLPYHEKSHPVTGLTRNCAVILNWYATIAIPDDCDFLADDVPKEIMRSVDSHIRADLLKRLGAQAGAFAQWIVQLGSRH